MGGIEIQARVVHISIAPFPLPRGSKTNSTPPRAPQVSIRCVGAGLRPRPKWGNEAKNCAGRQKFPRVPWFRGLAPPRQKWNGQMKRRPTNKRKQSDSIPDFGPGIRESIETNFCLWFLKLIRWFSGFNRVQVRFGLFGTRFGVCKYWTGTLSKGKKMYI